MNLEDLQIVLKVAEFRSITAAATSLDMHTATASAAIKRVEALLGFDLFIRSTRRLRLSSEGERYIPQCEQALLMLEHAKLGTKEDLAIVDGEIRIAVSSDLGRNIVMPWLDEFVQTYPKISLKVNVSDSNIDFYRDSVDIAVRYGSPNDASLYGFKICDIPVLLCASPDYLVRKGTPKHPSDLASHNGLFYQLNDVTHDVWTFSGADRDKAKYKIKMKGNRLSNDGDLVRRWCVAGRGIAVKSCLDMSNDLLSGKVVNVMPEYKARSTELWLVCPSRQLITPAVRLLRDAFREKSVEIMKKLENHGVFEDKVC
ncbi:MAG: LysR family transcriptional regulator [Kangiellaceae bacterium]|nr:LysR family transcriptional regulator [Kangiellaceae bacterium]MCW9015485.1 LysR family transcriptional regulator [Kangiellaceae bacterium]